MDYTLIYLAYGSRMMRSAPIKQILILIFLTLPVFAMAKKIPHLRMLTYPFAPYAYKVGQEVRGPGYALLEHICKNIKVRCSVEMMAWREALWQVRRGKADGIFFVEGRGDQDLWMHLTKPVMQTEYGIFTPLDLKLLFSSAKDLRVIDWHLGSVKDTPSWYYFTRMIENGTVKVQSSAYPDFIAALNDLRDKKINGVYMNKYAGFWLSRHTPIKNIRFAGSDRKVPLYFGFSKRKVKASLVDKFNAELDVALSSGLIDKVKQHHLIH